LGAGDVDGTEGIGDAVDVVATEAVDAEGPAISAGLDRVDEPDKEGAIKKLRRPGGVVVAAVEADDSGEGPENLEKSAKDVAGLRHGPATKHNQTNRAGGPRGTVSFNGNTDKALRNRRGLSNGNRPAKGVGSGRVPQRGLTNGAGLSNGNDLVNGSRSGPTTGAKKGMVTGRGMTMAKATFNRIGYAVLILGIASAAVGLYWDPLNGRLMEFSSIGPLQMGVVTGGLIFCILGFVFLIVPWEKDAEPRPRWSGVCHGSRPKKTEKTSPEEE